MEAASFDLGSLVVIAIIVAVVALVIRALVRKGKDGCIDCSEESCAHHGLDAAHTSPDGAGQSQASCPEAERMIRDIDALLEKTDSAGAADSADAADTAGAADADAVTAGGPSDALQKRAV